MLNITKNTPRTKTIAIMIVFIAIYATLRVIPSVPMIGASGASFSLSDIVAPLYGLILGPYIGGLSVIIGSLVAFFGKPPVFMGLDFLPATVAAVSLGLIIKRKWIPVIALNLVLLVAFSLHPNTSLFVDVPLTDITIPIPFVWLHIVAFLALVSPLGRKAVDWVSTPTATRAATGIAILFFVGTMMQHLTGNLLFETILAQPIGGIDAETFHLVIWPGAFFAYPIERAALVVLGTIVGTPLLRILKNYFHF